MLAASCASEPTRLPPVPVSGPITVIVSRGNALVPGATVIFHGPTGAVFGTAVTDGGGRATGDIEAPGMVTVVDPDAATPSLLTLTELSASDSPFDVPLVPPLFDAGPDIGTIAI